MLPAQAGIGLKPEHYDAALSGPRRVGWVEVHAENYMVPGGPAIRYLERIRERYPLSLHGVGLSLASEQPLDRRHLRRLERLIDRFEPDAFSEHLAWSTHGSTFFNDLLPVPYNDVSLTTVIEHVDQAQEALGKRLLLENPSTYVAFRTSTIPETEFLGEVVRRTGCGLLLDVNNVFVSATNHGYDPLEYIGRLPLDQVAEIHLAGHAREHDEHGDDLLIDSHDRAVADAVWELYDEAIRRVGPVPTLIEWDADVPDLETLLNQALIADGVLSRCRGCS